MGKTNLLDAIYYLCMGKSHFGVRDRHILRHKAEFLRLEGVFNKQEKKEKIVAKVIPGKKKEFEQNTKPYPKLSEHIGRFPIVIIAPDDTYIAKEGSEARRKFLNNSLSQLDQTYLQHLILYNKVLKQRNAILKQFVETRHFDPSLLHIYNDQLLEPAHYIHQARLDFIEKFRPLLQQTYQIISGSQETVDCTYQSALKETPYKDLLKLSEEKDRVLQRTTTGIHKDDLRFTIQGYPLKRLASQGQMKSFILSLKLAQYDLLKGWKKVSPILLLDDIFDKLDEHRVTHLLNLLLNGSFGQIFITDTHDDRVDKIVRNFASEHKTFQIIDGKASKL